MKKLYPSLLFVLCVLFCSNLSFGQMVGTQIYLPGHWLEIGQTNYGSFGATPPPAGYHPFPGGSYLAETYDYGHDGWTVGAPPLMGDYTYPGSPFEGWGIQVNGTTGLNWAFTSSGAITGTGSLTGNNLNYVNAGGKLVGNWTGTAAGGQLKINMETRVDTNASWVVVTAKLYNTGATTLNNIYYIRTLDPDNDEAHGGSFATYNQVTFQIDADQRVGVQATGETYTYAYLQLCTKDCRAKALVYSSWPINFYVTDLSTVYTGTAGIAPVYTVGLADNGDIATGIVYSLGNLCAGDSTFVSYAYTFLNTKWGIDSAFPEPSIVVNGVPVIPPPAPAAIYDTFNVCLYPGMTVLPVDLSSATSGVWTWSKWTWSPGTGLASTTGVTNTINVNLLPPSITYTITGTPFSSCGGTPATCGSRVIYLTVKTCNGATVNTPCLGDPLFFNAPGDSLGATYVWLGPNSWTTTVATTQSFTISPSVWADTGTYHVIKTVAGTSDTSVAIVVIHPTPEVIATNNGPLCNDPVPANTLSLTATVTLATVTSYSWTGPAGFTSSIQNPTRSSFVSADSGVYTIIVTTAFGCKDTGTTDVAVFPPPGPPLVTDRLVYCQGDPFTPFTVVPEAGATVYWYPSAAGGVGSTTTPTVNTTIPGTYTFYYGESIGLCQSPIDSITVIVNPLPAVPVATNNSPICADSLLKLFATDGTAGVTYSWSGPYSFTSALQNPTIPNAQAVNSGTYNVIATVAATGCHTSSSTTVTIKPTPAAPVLSASNPCDSFFTLNLTATDVAGCTYSWSGPSGYTSGMQNNSIFPAILGVNDGTYTVVATLNGCPSLPATVVAAIRPNPLPPITRDSAYCQFSPTALLTYQVDSLVGSHLNWYNSQTGGLLLGHTPPHVDSSIVTYPSADMWWVSQTAADGCESHRALIADTIVYQPNFTIIASKTWVCDHDTLSFAYSSTTPLTQGSFQWVLPPGATIVSGSATDSAISVRFDSVYGAHVVSLTVGELNYMCWTTQSINITVIALPTSHCHLNPDICLGDTVSLFLSDRSNTAEVFSWLIDGIPLASSPEVNIVASSSNSGGPFSISWNDTGVHIITLSCHTHEGCRSDPTHDTCDVHERPDASFRFEPKTVGTLCLEDSVQFIAYDSDCYNCSYYWEPEHSFHNDNKPRIWGKVEESKSDIMLTVTDPFGCTSSSTTEINPNSCCTVLFPNAFTPNGDGKNDHFRPIFNGYHRFHSFRVVNRWGQTVFESANSDPWWDGTFNGAPCDMGVYYYYLKYDCGGSSVEVKGDCTLVR